MGATMAARQRCGCSEAVLAPRGYGGTGRNVAARRGQDLAPSDSFDAPLGHQRK